jgi:hypothetical protein
LVGALGSRAIGSYLREFETLDPDGAVKGANDLADVVEALREFFLDSYEREVVPLLEQHHVIPFDQIPANEIPALGLVLVLSECAALCELRQRSS